MDGNSSVFFSLPQTNEIFQAYSVSLIVYKLFHQKNNYISLITLRGCTRAPTGRHIIYTRVIRYTLCKGFRRTLFSNFIFAISKFSKTNIYYNLKILPIFIPKLFCVKTVRCDESINNTVAKHAHQNLDLVSVIKIDNK